MPSEVKVYHNPQPTDGESPSPLENHLASSYSLAEVVLSSGFFSRYEKENLNSTTTNSVYAEKVLADNDDDLIDEVGEADDDKYSAGSEEETFSSSGTDLFSNYFGTEEDNYAALEPSRDLYVQSLLDTEIEVLRPYDPRLKLDVGGEFYVSYYKSWTETEEPLELGAEREEEPMFAATSKPTEDDTEPEEVPGDLESRLGFRKSA